MGAMELIDAEVMRWPHAVGMLDPC